MDFSMFLSNQRTGSEARVSLPWADSNPIHHAYGSPAGRILQYHTSTTRVFMALAQTYLPHVIQA